MTSFARPWVFSALSALLVGCGGGRTDLDEWETFGRGGIGATTGGHSSTGTGGTIPWSSTKVLPLTGGRPNTGGTIGKGGTRNTGGYYTGGWTATGGKSYATGGKSAYTGGFGGTVAGAGGKGGAGGTLTGGFGGKSSTTGGFGGVAGFGGAVAGAGGKGGTSGTLITGGFGGKSSTVGGFGGAIGGFGGAIGGFGGAIGGAGGTVFTGGSTGIGGTSGIPIGGTSPTGGTVSTGGTSSTGGTTGTGGSSTCPSYLAANEEIIDDMDDGNATIPTYANRRGAWADALIGSNGASMSPDPNGAFFVTDTGDPCKKFAVYVHGQTSVDSNSGANFGFTLGSPYDASVYTGLSFWARIDAGTNPPVRVSFPDKDTDPRGAVCQTSTADPSLTCWSHFGTRISLTTTWTKYTIPFAKLTQDPWGYQASSFDPSTLFGVIFQIGENDTFGIWIDSVAFTK